MKSIIKNISTLLFVVITFTSAELVNAKAATADTTSLQYQQIEAAFVYGLESDVSGVLESTFFNIIAFKTMNVDFESEEVAEGLQSVVNGEFSHALRYKAALTLKFMESPVVSDELNQLLSFEEKYKTFQYIDETLKGQQLTAN